MKFGVLVFSALFSTVTFADCSNSFNEGISHAELGNKYVNHSNQNLALMQKLINNGSSNAQVCEAGQSTRMGAFQAAVAFKKSRAFFLNAVNECDSPNDSAAAGNADFATKQYNTNAELVAKFDNILGANCGAKPLTPLLNQ